MLPADDQEVIWIDGLSIELNQLSPELEPVGICVAINGNKAIVRYKEEFDGFRWADSMRLELDDVAIVDLITKGQPVSIKINDMLQNSQLSLTGVSSRQDFVDALNGWFIDNGFSNYSTELVELDTDLPASDTSDEKDGDNYRNRIIINAKFIGNNDWVNITIGEYRCKYAFGKHIFKDTDIFCIYYNNGFFKLGDELYPLNKAKIFDFIIPDQEFIPDTPLDSIWNYGHIVNKDNFENNENCQILRDNFASYDDYVDSFLVKVPCGVGEIGEHPSGKENTYKLSDCKYTKLNDDKEYLYPAAHKAASIDVRGPKLNKGNWWLPSPAEMAQMMRDITYETSFWDSKPDIVNRVIDKIRKVDTNWTNLSASTYRWMPFLFYAANAIWYCGDDGTFYMCSVNDFFTTTTPITIYEF